MDVRHPEYPERVYAGVLGKIVGVYLGRPFEQRSQEWIKENLGEIDGYVHERMGQPLIVTDDDISGTFAFLRALEDYGPDVTSAQIGETWLNQIIEGRTILWWGGLGSSTEHTAYLRLKKGIKAPRSGSIASNGRIVAEQIGAQIFIDGWGLVNPGDPERAAAYARRAASVSHDGVAVHGAQVVAAMVAGAFAEERIESLLDQALDQIPADSRLRRVIDDIREWRERGHDWRDGFRLLDERYGYARYGGGCHIVPNHALVIHALLHSGGSFDEALKVVNSCGMDTDCNSGNVGCIMAVRGGLAAIDARWREPVADRLFIPTAEGGRCVSDAVQIADWVVRLARGEGGAAGAKYHFAYPGSVQGFQAPAGMRLRNVRQALAVDGTGQVWTSTFPQREERTQGGYGLVASPTLYSGQVVRAKLREGDASLFVAVDRGGEDLDTLIGPALGGGSEVSWTVPDTGPHPIVRIGLEVQAEVVLDWLTWDGEPNLRIARSNGTAWRLPWTQACDGFESWDEPFRLTQNEGVGLLSIGNRDWRDIDVSSQIRFSLIERGGLAVRVQGLRRYYALEMVRGGGVRLIRQTHDLVVLAERDVGWELEEEHELRLVAQGTRLRGYLDGVLVLEAADTALDCGGAAFVVSEGRLNAQGISIRSART